MAVIHSFEERKKTSPIFFVGFIILMAVLGTGTGYLLSTYASNTTTGAAKNQPAGGASDTDVVQTAGIKDEKLFPDKAQGILQEGGLDGEGSYNLQRPGGQSQTAYLTSSTVDLAPFVGKKVRVWGATYTGQKAGWLMDVGYVETM